MQWFYGLKISKKIIGSFSLVILIAVIIGYVGLTIYHLLMMMQI